MVSSLATVVESWPYLNIVGMLCVRGCLCSSQPLDVISDTFNANERLINNQDSQVVLVQLRPWREHCLGHCRSHTTSVVAKSLELQEVKVY